MRAVGSSTVRRRAFLLLLTVLVPVVAVFAAAPAGAAPAREKDEFGIGRRELTLVDSTRPTMADPARGIPAKPDRTLRTLVLYPTATGVDDPPVTGATAAKGKFPLLVFSHGFTATGDLYAPFLDAFVRDGYVVALPTFPLTSGAGASFPDYVNQPADVSFVIDRLEALSDDKASWLGRRVDEHRVGVLGHSMGGLNTLALAFNQCCIDSRIDAAASIAGGELEFPGGSWADRPDTPVLLIHGVADDTVPVAGSELVFAAATGPASFLRLTHADHVSVFFGEDGVQTILALKAFFDAELRSDKKDLRAMPETVARLGRGEWLTR